MKASLMALVLTLTFLVWGTGLAYAAPSVKDIEKELICQCGCTMVVETCQCETADQFRAEIARMIDEGQTKEQILDYYVSRYGEAVLSAPTKKGFNLTVWVVPFVGLAAGGAALYFILRMWAARGKAPLETAPPPPSLPQERDDYSKRFHDEFSRFKEEEDR